MAKAPEFDLAEAHKYFSAQCFNSAWDLIEKAGRTPEDDELMLALNQASIYHWRQRDDCTRRHLSIGYWQASRIHALLGHPAEALRLGELCHSYSGDLEPFYLGYAHEAMARAHRLAGNSQKAQEHLARSRDLAERVGEKSERELLESDLNQLENPA